MDQKITISIIKGVYVYYMFNIFKTSIDINNPFEYIFTGNTQFLKHPINTGVFQNKICPLGHIAGKLLLLWFIIRNYINYSLSKKLNKLFLTSTLIISFVLNWNAFIYFLPVFFIDRYYQF